MNKSNMSWEQAFRECNESINRHELTMKITNELYPSEDGILRDDWIGFPKEHRDAVYTEMVAREKI